MAIDPRTSVDTSQDPGLTPPSTGFRNTKSTVEVIGAKEVKTVVLNYTDPAPYQEPHLQIFNDPAGNDGQVQYMAKGRFAADNNLRWNPTTKTLGVIGNIIATNYISGKISTTQTNLRITGGADGYVLTTDGTGNIRWHESSSVYGNSNVPNYLPTYTGSLTAGNANLGNLTILGNILPTITNTSNIGSPDKQFKELFMSSGGSIYLDGVKLSTVAGSLQVTNVDHAGTPEETQIGSAYYVGGFNLAIDGGSGVTVYDLNDQNIDAGTAGTFYGSLDINIDGSSA